MSRLIEVNENRVGSIDHPTAIVKLLESRKVEQVVADGSAATIYYSSRVGKKERGVDESITDIETAVNAANVTASAEQLITLTIKRLGGNDADTGGFPQTRKVLVREIVEVTADPADATDSIVVIQPETEQGFTTFYVDETVAAIKADANA